MNWTFRSISSSPRGSMNSSSDGGHSKSSRRRKKDRPGSHHRKKSTIRYMESGLSSPTVYRRKSIRRKRTSRRKVIFKFWHNLNDRNKGLLAIAFLSLIMLVVLIIVVYAVRLYPISGGLSIGCVSSILYHVFTESTVSTPTDSYLHDHHEAENRFWSALAFVFTCAVIFGETPISFGYSNPILGMLVALLTTVYMYGIQRDMTRARLRRSAKLPNSTSWASAMNMSMANKKLESVERDLSIVDVSSLAMKWLPSRKRAILDAERRIIETFRDATQEELNFLVSNSQLALIFYKIKDRDVMRLINKNVNNHRTKILELLSVKRASEMGVRSKVAVLDALQKMRLNAHPRGEEFVHSILTSTKGHDLTRLKCFMDSKGTFHNMHKLIFSDVRNEETRRKILAHIYDEGLVVRRKSLRTRLRKRRLRKVLSDVDDTLLSSGGRFPAGCDRSYPRKALYPGVLAFYEELDKQHSAPTVRFAHNRMATASNLTFLSARPHVYKDTSESVTYRKFSYLRKHRGLHTEPTLLAGGLDSGLKMFTGDFGPLAAKKVLNFTQYAAIYPEFEFVFIGDNGQGDVLTAECMMKSNISSRVESVFIHLVRPLDATPGARPNAGQLNRTPVSSPVLGSMQTPPPSPQGNLKLAPLGIDSVLNNPVPGSPVSTRSSEGGFGENNDEDASDSEFDEDTPSPTITTSTTTATGNKGTGRSSEVRVNVLSSIRDTQDDSDGAGRWKRMGMIFFHTYIGASIEAAKLGKITYDGCWRIARSALRDFYMLDENEAWVGGITEFQREAARLELNRDIREFNEFATSHPDMTPMYKPIPYIPCAFAPTYPPRDDVQTPYGIGKVVGRRQYDATYEVRLTKQWCATVYCPVSVLSWPKPVEIGSRVRCDLGWIGKVTDCRFRDGTYTVRVDKSKTLYLHHSAIKSRVRAVIGDVVRVSKYGMGVVLSWRSEDEMYKVELYWGNQCRPVVYVLGDDLRLVETRNETLPSELLEKKSKLEAAPDLEDESSVFCSWRLSGGKV